MKGCFHGIKVSQVALILIGLVCATVFVLAWTRATFLTSLIPTQMHILQLDPGSRGPLQGQNISEQTTRNQVQSVGSSSIEPAIKGEDSKNVAAPFSMKEDGLSSVLERTGPEKLTKEKNKSKQAQKNLVKPDDTVTTDSSIKREQTRNMSSATKKKGCNYSKGKWVFDDRRPLYSGSDCKQWLSSMWACRLTQRTDFEFEKLRWEPKDCEMEEFTASIFLERMRGKTLAFVGDSLGRQQFQSLMCMVTSGEKRLDVLNVGYKYGLVKARGAIRPDGWAYWFPDTNTTILYYWSASLCDLEPIDVSNSTTDIAMHLDRPPAFLRQFLSKFDVLVLNTGHHWNSGKLKANRWVIYVGGVPNTNAKFSDVSEAKTFAVHSIIKWVNSQLPKFPGHKAFFRSISPRHFFNGDWNTGGTCDNVTPLSGGKEVLQDDSSDHLAATAVNGTRVNLLDITALSELRDEGHISRYSIQSTNGVQDCLHWCLPGIPDIWNEILFAQL